MLVVVVSKAVGPTVGVAVVVVVAFIMRSLAALTSVVVLVIWTFVCVRYHVRNRVNRMVVEQVSLSGE